MGEQIEDAISFIDEREFTEFCVRFDKRFPDFMGEEQYCRPIFEVLEVAYE